MIRTLVLFTTLALFSDGIHAAIVFDSGGFEAPAYSGSGSALVGQNGWEDLLPPQGSRFSVNAAPVALGVTGQVAIATGAAEVAAFVAPKVNYTPSAGEIVTIEVDIARTISPLPFPQQVSSPGFGVDIYEENALSRTAGFGLGYNQNNHAIEAFVTFQADGQNNGLSRALNLNVAPSTFVNFRAEMNYDTDTFKLFVDGVDASTLTTGAINGEFQFANPASQLGDADLQHDSLLQSGFDTGYFDNYRISTVPEPSSIGLIIAIGTGLTLRRRRS